MTAATATSIEGLFWRPSAPAAPPLRVARVPIEKRSPAGSLLAAFFAFALILTAAPHATSINPFGTETRVAAQTDPAAASVGAQGPETPTAVGANTLYGYDGVLGCCVAPNTTTGFRAPATSVNRHGQLTNGSYTVDGVGNAAHQTGNLGSGSSQFLYRVDADSAVLDAAAYADDVGLWGQGVNVHPNQAVVFIENGPVGVLGRSGELTNWIKVTRTDTGFVHGWPASGP